MEPYNKQELNKVLDSNLVIHWWNHRRKTLDFNGTVKEYLKQHNVTYKVTEIQQVEYKNLSIKVKFNYGNLNDIKFSTNSMEDAVRMVINIQLSYLGDKAQFTFNHRTKTINF